MIRLILILFGFLFIPWQAVTPAEPPPRPGSAAAPCARDGIYAEAGHICFVAPIDAENANSLLRLMDARSGDLFIKSRGGDVRPAWDIGRRLHAERRGLVVLGSCYSSCANYLVPAAARLEVRRGGVILLHGSPPRAVHLYVASVARGRGLSFQRPSDHAAIRQVFANYPNFHRDFIVPEAQYFVDIGKTDGFIVRYWEILRNLEYYANDRCDGQNTFVIVGPRYLEGLASIRATDFWWPENRQELVDLLAGFSSDTNFVFDMDLMPGWIAGQGLVTQAECLRPLDSSPAARR
jgi:hypothetical protein